MTLQDLYGHRITGAWFEDNVVGIYISLDGSNEIFEIRDTANYCCESRWMTTDDDVRVLEGLVLSLIEVLDGPKTTDENTEYTSECQFLRIHAGPDVVVFKSYNEHNGYYGGFDIEIHNWTGELIHSFNPNWAGHQPDPG